MKPPLRRPSPKQQEPQLKTIENLLASGVSPDLPDQYRHTPIYYAASFNETKAVELLLADQADANPRDHRSQYAHQMPATPLQSAAELGNRRIVSLLIAVGRARQRKRAGGPGSALHCANRSVRRRESCSSITARTSMRATMRAPVRWMRPSGMAPSIPSLFCGERRAPE